MDTPTAHRAFSPACKQATLTPDQQAWQVFIHDPNTLTWIRRIVRAVYGHVSQNRADTLLTTAWIALAEDKDYQSARGRPISFARTVIKGAWATAARDRLAVTARLERLDDVLSQCAHDHAWLHDEVEEQRRYQRQNQSDVRDVLSRLTGDAQRWAETYVAVLRDMDVPTTVVNHQRANPIVETQNRLGWTRHKADQVRAQVARERHLRRLAPMRPAA